MFDITEEECRQFAAMERQFQAYMLGDYIPVWQLYDCISEGVLPIRPMIEQGGARERAMRIMDVFLTTDAALAHGMRPAIRSRRAAGCPSVFHCQTEQRRFGLTRVQQDVLCVWNR